jgi:uracil-DNA glycosylase
MYSIDSKWQDIIDQESTQLYFKKLMAFIDSEYKDKVIFPKRSDLFNAFLYTSFQNTKIVIIGQDPYHDYNQAHGLAFSVKKGNKIPPSLRNIYTELFNDLNVLPASHGDLTEWAKQGVLLMNTILTVEAHKPLSHKKKGWEQFTDAMIRKLDQDDNPKVFMLWGNNAKKKKELIHNSKHLVIESSHPSPLGARHSFFGSKCFSRANEFLEANNRKKVDFTIM